MNHTMYSVSNRIATCLSLVALDKSIESASAISRASGNSSQLLTPTQKPRERTRRATHDIKIFKGIRTPHQ